LRDALQQRWLHLWVSTDQFILGIDAPHGKRAGKLLDQLV
jgi:hypothetical protein